MLNKVILILGMLLFFPWQDVYGQEQPLTVEEVKDLLPRKFGAPWKFQSALLSHGELAFPAFLEILKDPKELFSHKRNILLILQSQTNLDRSMFIDVSLELIVQKDSHTDDRAMELLRDIGTEKELPIAVVMLDSGDGLLTRCGLEMLRRLGGEREQRVLEKWIEDNPFKAVPFKATPFELALAKQAIQTIQYRREFNLPPRGASHAKK